MQRCVEYVFENKVFFFFIKDEIFNLKNFIRDFYDDKKTNYYL